MVLNQICTGYDGSEPLTLHEPKELWEVMVWHENHVKFKMDKNLTLHNLFQEFSLCSSAMSDNKESESQGRELEALGRRVQRLERRIHNTRQELWSPLHNWEGWKMDEEHILLMEIWEFDRREAILVHQAQEDRQHMIALEAKVS